MLLHHYRFTPDESLLDVAALRHELKAGDSSIEPLRHSLADIRERLDARFRNGADIRDLIFGRAWCIDQLLSLIWERIDWPTDNIALLAVGGYGRGELHPHSDIDLLILLEESDDTRWHEALSAFITLLWDIGLEIGHSVRTLDECEREARNDVTVITNLLETRTIAGPKRLRDRMQTLTSPHRMWSDVDFFEAKWQEQLARHERFNNSEHHLEPNIKSSPGGLRDIQTVSWIAKRHFGARAIEETVAQGFITDNELRIISQGRAFLWQIRYALHLLAGRAEDRLLFDQQRAIAELLGYRDTPERLAVEQFMRRYYRIVTALSELNDMLLQHFEEAILQQGQQQGTVQILNRRFEVIGGDIRIRHPAVFKRRPSALLEIFLLMAQHPGIEGVRAETIRAIRDHRHLIDDAFRRDLRHRSLFMELLRSGGNVPRQLGLMARYGVLGKYLPSFGRIIGLMQHDLFHVYTVDAHTLRLLSVIQQFRSTDGEEHYPLCAQLTHQLPRLEVLWIAGLLHDIGKGRGGDHSLIGAEEAQIFCEQHGLSRRDTHLVCWLIEHHLLMSTTAQKRDIADPDVIREFAATMHDELHLDYLYVLTVADINATNASLWNGWRAALLRQLHGETRRVLRRGLENPPDRGLWIEETRDEARALLLGMGSDPQAVESLWQTLGDDYFLYYSASEIAWHTQGILRAGDNVNPLVLISAPTDDMTEGGTKVFIHTRAVNNLFAATAAAMEQLGLSIHDARIATSSNEWTLNTFIILDEHGEPIRERGQLAAIHYHLVEELDDPDDYPRIVSRHTPRQLKHFRVPTRVTIEQDDTNARTMLEVIAADRPGLLARVGRIFMECGVSLTAAKIATLGERVEDVFFITDTEGQPLTDPAQQHQLHARLCEVLDAQAGVT
ncbi:[protein-PII] uridylyltransferase [Kushneria phosphatilytica]|uniref:Bifunctional uridylyltransferase/uridylyl-removing enzyme n=1 Tax=Kushneria phosphatilytica TaxID=657387 RepID=A0A1S1NQ12_9GAMM|nr:[protein-PII] uridylyltransferase [Kushneria phosphatilytica]OHV10469.1 [protein-PII] uridylyltransferase [Kushneria phosphatilytica]QEL11981.1 [protein-PII] uridylyltransferase [Kushneria phosphatilytica]